MGGSGWWCRMCPPRICQVFSILSFFWYRCPTFFPFFLKVRPYSYAYLVSYLDVRTRSSPCTSIVRVWSYGRSGATVHFFLFPYLYLFASTQVSRHNTLPPSSSVESNETPRSHIANQTKTMKTFCEVCTAAPASLVCCADDAVMCGTCDQR